MYEYDRGSMTGGEIWEGMTGMGQMQFWNLRHVVSADSNDG